MRQHGQQDRANGKLILGRMTDISKDVERKGDFYTETVNKIYKEYEELCIRDDLVDFGELLLKSYEVLVNSPQ